MLPPSLIGRPDAQEIVNLFARELGPSENMSSEFRQRVCEEYDLDRFGFNQLQTWFSAERAQNDDANNEAAQTANSSNNFRPHMPDPLASLANHPSARSYLVEDEDEEEEVPPQAVDGNFAPQMPYPMAPPSMKADETYQDDDEFEDENEPDQGGKSPLLIPPQFKKHLSQFPEEYLDGHYQINKYIGKGAYGIVASAIATESNPRVEPGKRVAIKKMTNIFQNVFGTKRLLRELKVLRALNGHDCIVKLIDIKIPHPKNINDFDTILLVFEWIEWDLNKLMKMDTFLSDRQVKAVLKRILYGVKYMHSAEIVHRDLKPANILLNSKVQVKVCDFGLSRCIKENSKTPKSMSQELMEKTDDPHLMKPLPFKPRITQHVVTRYYRAPEVCMKEQTRSLLPKIDVWAIGCIFAELLQMIKLNCESLYEREILLPGVCDEMLTPPNPSERGVTNDRIPRDQLQIIFDFCGTPTEDLIKKVRNPKTRAWLRSLEHREPQDYKERFPYGPPQALDLLQKFLVMDPEHRISIDEALNHPWLRDFEDVKSKRDHEGVHFTFEDVPLTRQLLKSLIVDEILYYNEDLRVQLIQRHSQESARASQNESQPEETTELGSPDFTKKESLI